MMNTKIIIIALLAMGGFCSCSQLNNRNGGQESQTETKQTSESSYSDQSTLYDGDDEPEGMSWGDPDEPQEESSGLSFFVKYVGSDKEEKADIKQFYMFFTTSDNKLFYEYDDESDYGEYALRCYMVHRSIFNNNNMSPSDIQKNIKTMSPWLGSFIDLPEIGPIPKEMKKYISKIYYDFKNTSVRRITQKYGVQSYLIGDPKGLDMGFVSEKDIIFRRYEKKEGDGLDEVPDEAVMIKYEENFTILSY